MKKEYLYAGISILLWSTTSTITKLLLGSLNSMQILLISSIFAALFLFIINFKKKNLSQLKSFKIKDFAQIAGLGILGTFLSNLFLYLGINKMQASQAFIINYLWPLMTVIFACIILKEKLTKRKLIAIILSFIGVIVVTSNGDLLKVDKDTILGAIYCILAAVFYGLFCVLNKQKNYDKYLSMMLFYCVSAIILFIYILLTKTWFFLNGAQIAGILWIGVFTSAIAFTSWAIALEKGDTAKISNLAYITPFLSLIWTALILKETISIYAIVGLLIIVLGIVIQLKEKEK